MTDKFPESERTFETRLLFIKYLFEYTYESEDILNHCLAHKLDRSFLLYEEEIAKSVKRLGESGMLELLQKVKNL